MVELETSSLVPLAVTRRAVINLDAAYAKLGELESGWLGAIDDQTGEGGRRTVQTDLGLPLRAAGRQLTVRKAALIEIGHPRRANGYLVVEVCWRAASLAPLFPVFAGQLTVEPDRLRLDGLYAPPLGRLGVALDRALLGIAARHTARWFLEQVARGFGARYEMGPD